MRKGERIEPAHPFRIGQRVVPTPLAIRLRVVPQGQTGTVVAGTREGWTIRVRRDGRKMIERYAAKFWGPA